MGLLGQLKRKISLEKKEAARNALRQAVHFLWYLTSPFKESIDSENIKRVLVINLGVIGDLLVTTPMIRALNNKFESVDVLMKKDMRDVLSLNPNINKMIFYENFEKTLKKITGKYELAIIFAPQKYEMKKLCKDAGITYVIGNSFSYSLSDVYLTARAKEDKNEHMVQKALDMARLAGADLENPKIDFYFSESDEKRALNLLNRHEVKEFVVLHPGKRGNDKEFFWPSENWAEIADYIVKRYGYDVILTGSSSEKERNREIMRHVKSERVFNFCNKTNLKELGCLLKKAKFLVSLNTGMTHIASAFDKDIIVFNEKFPKNWHPWTGGYYKILLSPGVEEVKTEIETLSKK